MCIRDSYDMASEFTDIVIRLWNEIEPIDVNGDYYQVRGRIKKPRTMQAPTPLLVSAGASPAGTAFAARFCDQLVTLASDEEALRAVDARLSEATAATGRTVATCPFAIALVRDEEGRAEEEWDGCVRRLIRRPRGRSPPMCSVPSSPLALSMRRWATSRPQWPSVVLAPCSS